MKTISDEARKRGIYLASLRGKCGFVQAELAERVGVTLRTVQKWESGEYEPTRHYEIVAEVLKTSVAELRAGESIQMSEAKKIDETMLSDIVRNEKNKRLILISSIALVISGAIIFVFGADWNAYVCYPTGLLNISFGVFINYSSKHTSKKH